MMRLSSRPLCSISILLATIADSVVHAEKLSLPSAPLNPTLSIDLSRSSYPFDGIGGLSGGGGTSLLIKDYPDEKKQ